MDTLSFGSECGDVAALEKIVDVMQSDRFPALLRYHLEGGIAFPEAQSRAVAEIGSDKLAALLARPNNTLGVEYIKAIRALAPAMQTFTVPRMGAEHDDMAPIGDTASASFLRTVILSGKMLNAAPYMPRTAYRLLSEAAAAGHCPADAKRLERGVLAALRQMSADQLAACPGISEGLQNRVKEAVATAATLDELEQAIKTRRYPLTRIRRMLWSAFLGVPADLGAETPPYARVLGYNDRGREILNRAREASAPLLGRASQAEKLTGTARQVWELESRAADLYALTLPKPFACGAEYTTGVIHAE